METRLSATTESAAVGPDLFAGCSFHGPMSGRDVHEAALGRYVVAGAFDGDDLPHAFLYCNPPALDGIEVVVWPVGDPVPEVGEILVRTAVNRLVLPTPFPGTAPDGLDTPLLTNLEVPLWIPDAAWQPQTSTVALVELGLSATVVAEPAATRWDPDDGSPTIDCDQGVPWRPGQPSPAPCSHIYRAATPAGTTNTLAVTTVFDLSVTCVPAGLCATVDLPTVLRVTVERPVRVTEARGVLTR